MFCSAGSLIFAFHVSSDGMCIKVTKSHRQGGWNSTVLIARRWFNGMFNQSSPLDPLGSTFPKDQFRSIATFVRWSPHLKTLKHSHTRVNILWPTAESHVISPRLKSYQLSEWHLLFYHAAALRAEGSRHVRLKGYVWENGPTVAHDLEQSIIWLPAGVPGRVTHASVHENIPFDCLLEKQSKCGSFKGPVWRI